MNTKEKLLSEDVALLEQSIFDLKEIQSRICLIEQTGDTLNSAWNSIELAIDFINDKLKVIK